MIKVTQLVRGYVRHSNLESGNLDLGGTILTTPSPLCPPTSLPTHSVLNALQVLFHVNHSTTSNVFIPILQMGKTKHLARDHSANK